MIDLNHSRNLASRPRAGGFRVLFFLPVLLAGLVLLLAGPVTAQTFTTLYSFTGGSDGYNPAAGLVVLANTLYGTAAQGGSSDSGTVFAVNSDGTGFTNLHSFAAANTDSSGAYTNSDGAGPRAGLILSGDTLYGTAALGGSSGSGTVFAVSTNGTGFTNLHSFTAISTNSEGAYTNSEGAGLNGLLLSGNTLYGTAYSGGSSGHGTVFAMHTDGTGFTNLYSFMAVGTNSEGAYTNSDGAGPRAGLILSGNTLYGTAYSGGSSGVGTVFAVNKDGTGFTNLHSFTCCGNRPRAGLILSGNTLYGTTGGYWFADDFSTVFKVNTDGSGFTNLHSFTPVGDFFATTNSDGARPRAGLILSGDTLYGTAYDGGSYGRGTVFAVNTDGTGFTTLHTFTAGGYDSQNAYTNSDGAHPDGGLTLSGNTLYGTAIRGGSWDSGTVFSLSFTPQLTILPSAANVVLTWPTNYAGFDYTGYTLQSTTILRSSAIWSTHLPSPVVVNGQNTVTYSISGTQQFFRLSQ